MSETRVQTVLLGVMCGLLVVAIVLTVSTSPVSSLIEASSAEDVGFTDAAIAADLLKRSDMNTDAILDEVRQKSDFLIESIRSESDALNKAIDTASGQIQQSIQNSGER